MEDRILAHRTARPEAWSTIEAPLDVGQAILSDGSGASIYIVDCVTLLASSALMRLPDSRRWERAEAVVMDQVRDLLEGFERSDANWIVVSNEVGFGLVKRWDAEASVITGCNCDPNQTSPANHSLEHSASGVGPGLGGR